MRGGAARRVGAVARNEVRRATGILDRRSVMVVAALALGVALLTPLALERGLDFDHGLYRVAARDDSPLLGAVRSAPAFEVTLHADPWAELTAGRADLALAGDSVAAAAGPKGEAAMAALERASEDLAYAQLQRDPDAAAAFPVRVEVRYVARAPAAGAGPGTGLGGAGPGGLDGDGDGTAPGGQPAGGSGTVRGGGSGTAPGQGPGTGGGAGEDGARGPLLQLLPAERSVATPSTLAPPFPLRALVLAYLFLVPLNFVAQAYGGSAFAERIGRRGEPLLASPARPREILAGKALPYAVLSVATTAAVALAVGAGGMAFMAVLPLALAFLALEFVAAMFARSYRELTFLTVFISVALTVFAFLPAAFAGVHPLSFASPMTLVLMDLRGEPVGLAQAAYATLPLTLLAILAYAWGAALYREEDLFHQKPVPAKALDALARHVRGRGLASGVKLGLAVLPAVFVAELMLVAALVAVPGQAALPLALVGVAVVEELAKAAPGYAGVTRGKVPARRALAFGGAVGVGFFLGEKGFLLASLVGPFADAGAVAGSGAAGAGLGFGAGTAGGAALFGVPLLALALLVAPLLLHMGTAGLTARASRLGRAGFLAALGLAVVVHVAYNVAVLGVALGGQGVGLP